MNRYVFPLFLSLAIGAGAYVFLRDPSPAAMASAPQKSPNPPVVAKAANGTSPVTRAASKPEESPAWMSPPGPAIARTDRTAASAGSEASVAEDAKLARMQAVMAKFQRLQSEPNPKPGEVAAAIGELERANGSPVLNGVRLDVLRNNALVAQKMQTVGEDMRRLQSDPDGKSPQKLALVQARIAELQTLGDQLRSDVMESTRPRSATP